MGQKNKAKTKMLKLQMSNKLAAGRQKACFSSGGCSTKVLRSLSSSSLLGDDHTDTSSCSSRSLGSEDSFCIPSCVVISKEGAAAKHDPVTGSRPESEGPPYQDSSLFGLNMDGLRQLKKVEVKTRSITLKPNHLVPLEKSWGHSFVGFLAGSYPGFNALRELCNSWKVESKVFKHASGWIVFTFQNAKDRDIVFQGRPYQIYGRPLIIKPIPPCFEFDKTEMLRNVPVWVKFPGFPMDFRSDELLSELCSIIGTPLFADAKTSSMEICEFARVLIEIDTSQEPIETIPIVLFDGKTREQQVVYEFLPKFCSKCNRLGHSTLGCDTHKAAILKNKEKRAALAAAKSNLDKNWPDPPSSRAKSNLDKNWPEDTIGSIPTADVDPVSLTKSTVPTQAPASVAKEHVVSDIGKPTVASSKLPLKVNFDQAAARIKDKGSTPQPIDAQSPPANASKKTSPDPTLIPGPSLSGCILPSIGPIMSSFAKEGTKVKNKSKKKKDKG